MIEIIKHILHPEVIIPIMIFLIPISAILGRFYYKVQKLKMGHKAGLSAKDLALLHNTLEQNKNLNERVKNLETIITSLDKEILALKAQDDAESVKKIAEKIKK
jgi:hypothetical protein